MSGKNWGEILGWGEEQFDDLRFVGFSYIKEGKYDIALPFYRALVVLDPETAYNYQILGALYLELNKPQDALKYLRKALRYEPGNVPTLLNITKALFLTGQKHEGLDLAKQLQNEEDSDISSVAKALILAYT